MGVKIMAKNTTSANTEVEKILKPIQIKSKDNASEFYLLEFNRESIKFAEARGFKVQALEDGVSFSAIEDIFFYSFRMHQPNMSKAQTDKILYEDLGGMPEGVLERLVGLYLAPFETLVQNEDKGKNARLTVEL